MRNEPLRILQIVSNLEVGGAQEVVRTLAENLSLEGAISVVCTFRDGPLRVEIEKLGIPVVVLPERRNSIVAFPQFLMEIFQLRRELVRVVQKYHIDIVQTHLLRSFDFLVLSLRSSAGPKVFWTFHNDLFDLREDHLARHKWLLKPKRLAHHLLYRLGSIWVDGLIAVSKDVKNSILKTMSGIPDEKISVILNCVDLSRYGKKSGRDVLRQSLEIGEQDHLMTLVAILKRQKGHKVLIEALSEVTPNFPQLKILFVGQGELYEELRALTADLGLEDHIQFLGTRNDVPEILDASDSFVLPSLWEGLPMALIEAMASRLPIVATDVSGTRQVMLPGETGFVVPPDDSGRLATAIMDLLGNPERAQAMGLAARRRVETLFSARKQAREYIALFDRDQVFVAFSQVSS